MDSSFWYVGIRLVERTNIQIFACFQRNVVKLFLVEYQMLAHLAETNYYRCL